jgi:hypothetical protein
VLGAYFFVRNAVFKEADGFDERFFVYFEEVDSGMRAREAGWSTTIVRQLSVPASVVDEVPMTSRQGDCFTLSGAESFMDSRIVERSAQLRCFWQSFSLSRFPALAKRLCEAR